VGVGQGDYILETKFKYVGQGTDMTAKQETVQQHSGAAAQASALSCFTCAKSPRSGSIEQHVAERSGSGGAEYVQEAAFKYVGKGAGEFTMVEAPGQTKLAAHAERQLTRIANFFSPLNTAFALLVLIVLFAVVGLFWPSAMRTRSSDMHSGALSDDCVTRAIEVSLAGRQLPSTRVFHVMLDHSAWERFGFVLVSERSSLLVVGIEGGLLARWNKVYPHRRVRKGDRVVKVNGVSSSTPAMLKEFSKSEEMHLVILRANCPAEHPWTSTSTATTTRTEAVLHGSWDCYNWTNQERDMLHNWMVGEEQICTRSREDGYRYRYTHGKGAEVPGCGEACWCCRQKPQISTELNVVQLLFRPGLDYQGLVLNQLRAKTAANAKIDVVTVDSDDAGNKAQVLLRFDGIIGYGPSQVHPKCTIRSAKLSLNILNPGGGFQAHRMLTSWDETTTYEDFSGDGVTLGVEADATPLDSAWHVMTGIVSLDLTRAVQAWADGEQNYGIVLVSLSSDGIDFTTGYSSNPPTLSMEASWEVDQPNSERRDALTTIATSLVLSTTSESSMTTQTSTTTYIQMTTTLATSVASHGLHVEFYYNLRSDAEDWDAAVGDREPDFEQIVPDVSYARDSSRWDALRTGMSFAAQWSGTLILDVGGIYSFQVSSDDAMELAVDGDVLLGGDSGDRDFSTLLPSHRVTSKDMLAGEHAISVKLLLSRTDDNIAMQCMYQGPDTDGKMMAFPEASLRPIVPPAATPLQGGPERKFGSGPATASALQLEKVASASSLPLRLSSGAAVTVVSLALACALGLLVMLVVQHARKAQRELVQRRSLCHYNSLDLATLMHSHNSGGVGVHGHEVSGLA